MIYFDLMTTGMFIHHCLSFLPMLFAFYSGNTANFVVNFIFIAEISNPAMHARLVIKHMGMRYTKLYEFLEISYILLYTYGRLIIGTTIVLRCLTCGPSPFIMKSIGVGILV